MNVISHIIHETTPIPFNFIDSMMEKATREGDGSAGAIFQFNTESWDIQVAVLVFTDTHKDVIPIGSGVWIAMEWCSPVCNKGNIDIDCGPVSQGISHEFIILGCPSTECFHSMQSSIIHRQVHNGQSSGEDGRWIGHFQCPC